MEVTVNYVVYVTTLDNRKPLNDIQKEKIWRMCVIDVLWTSTYTSQNSIKMSLFSSISGHHTKIIYPWWVFFLWLVFYLLERVFSPSFLLSSCESHSDVAVFFSFLSFFFLLGIRYGDACFIFLRSVFQHFPFAFSHFG